MDITKLYQDIQHDLFLGIKNYDATYRVINELVYTNFDTFITIITNKLTVSEILVTSVELYSNEIIVHFIYEFIRCELIIFTEDPYKLHFAFYSLYDNSLLKTYLIDFHDEITPDKIDSIVLQKPVHTRNTN